MAIVRQAEQKPELKVEDAKVSKPAKTSKKKEVASDNSKSVRELKVELQKLSLEIKTGKESNTSLLRKTRKEIARKLSELNSHKNHNH